MSGSATGNGATPPGPSNDPRFKMIVNCHQALFICPHTPFTSGFYQAQPPPPNNPAPRAKKDKGQQVRFEFPRSPGRVSPPPPTPPPAYEPAWNNARSPTGESPQGPRSAP